MPPTSFSPWCRGEVDSPINAYTPALRKRRDDTYSPYGKVTRPERITIVYTNILHRLYPPIVIGDVEANLRRFVHYDYWMDSIWHGLHVDTSASASVLVNGAGEKPSVEIARCLQTKEPLRGIPVTGHTVTVAEFKAGSDSNDCSRKNR